MTTRSGLFLASPGSLNVALMTRVGDVQSTLTVSQIVNGLNYRTVMQEAKQNVAKHFSVVMRDPTTGLGAVLTSTIVAGLTVQIKKGSLTSYSTITPTLAIVGTTGLLDIAFTAAHLDTLSVAAVNVSGPGVLANDDLFIDVVAIDKTDAVRLGLTALPNAAAAAAGGLPTLGSSIPNVNAGASGGLPLQGGAVPNANAGSSGGLPTLGASIPTSNAGASGGLPTLGASIPISNAGASGGLPTLGGAIPVAAAGASGGLPLQGSAIPNAVAGASGGLPTLGASIPTANAGASGGLPTLGASIPTANAGASGGLPTLGGAIPSAGFGTSGGLPTKQNIDDDATAVIASVNAHTDSALGGSFPTPASIRDAVLDALLSDHSTPGSVADGVAIAAGLLQGNFVMDSVINTDPNGQTSARIRLFRNGTAAGAATSGGSGQGEFATLLVTTAYSAPGKVTIHKVVRQ
jgi:hypothetical protein